MQQKKTNPTLYAGQSSRWQQYIDLLEQKHIPEKARRWYVRRVEEFLRVHAGVGLRDLTGSQVEAYLRSLSSDSSLPGWQFKQVVDALRILLAEFAQASAAMQVDWDYWQQAVVAPNAIHATLARESLPQAVVSKRWPSFAVGSKQHEVLQAMARLIRARH